MKYIIIFIVVIILSCKKESIDGETCGENTINAKTSFGSFCSDFAELNQIDTCKKSLELFYNFTVKESSKSKFSIYFRLKSKAIGTYEPQRSFIRASDDIRNTWNIKINDAIDTKKTTVVITESTPKYISGYYEIDINGKDYIKGNFIKLENYIAQCQ